MTSIHKSEIENQKRLVTLIRNLRHRQRFPNLLNLVCDIEGVVYLMCAMLPHVGSSPHSGRSSKPLSQPLRLVGFLRFTGFFVGPVGQPGGGVFWHRPPEPDTRNPWDRLWDFCVLRAFLWDVWDNRGGGDWLPGTRYYVVNFAP